jgi:hypothetical protein
VFVYEIFSNFDGPILIVDVFIVFKRQKEEGLFLDCVRIDFSIRHCPSNGNCDVIISKSFLVLAEHVPSELVDKDDSGKLPIPVGLPRFIFP